MAILARAAIQEFPEYDYYWHLPGIRFGSKVQRNYNTLLGRYPGADGMKTGFICASGFNLVATATRDGKRLIAVVLGASSSAARAIKAAQLLERGLQRQPAVVADAVARHRSNRCSRSTSTRPICATKCAADTASARATEDEDDSAAVASLVGEFAPTRCSCRACARKTASRTCCKMCRLGEPVVVYTGPTEEARRSRAPATTNREDQRPATRRRPSPRRRKEWPAAVDEPQPVGRSRIIRRPNSPRPRPRRRPPSPRRQQAGAEKIDGRRKRPAKSQEIRATTAKQ